MVPLSPPTFSSIILGAVHTGAIAEILRPFLFVFFLIQIHYNLVNDSSIVIAIPNIYQSNIIS